MYQASTPPESSLHLRSHLEFQTAFSPLNLKGEKENIETFILFLGTEQIHVVF